MDSFVKPKSQQEPATVASIAAVRWRGRNRLYLAALGAAAVVAGAAGWWWHVSAPAAPHYATLPVSRGAIAQSVTATGTVNPVLTITVGSYVSGVIRNLYCDYNAQVRAGQICAQIDPRPFQAALDQFSGQLQKDRANLEKDRMDLVRYQKLASQNSIALQQAEDQAFTVQQDEAAVKLDEALVQTAKLNPEYTDIVAPVDGTVVSRNVTQGQTVAASFQTPTLFLIATNLQKMQIDTNVSESDVGAIKEGDPATFTVDAYPNRVFKGVVSQVRQSPQTVQNVVTYDAVLSVDNADLALRPGMTASTQVITDQRTDVLRVPNQALRFIPGVQAAETPGSGQSRVWVLRDNRLSPVVVKPGLSDANFTEVVEGDLRPGDQVVTAETRQPSGGGSGTPQRHP